MRRYATCRELADHLRVAEPTVRAWVRFTDVPTVRVGRLVRFIVDDVEKWVEAGGASQLAPAIQADAARRGVRP